jgi:hypothetical protein
LNLLTYLVDKYCLEDETTEECEEDELEPAAVQTRWSTGFVHGDSFEERVVALDEQLLPGVQRKVTITPHGIELRDFFLKRLESTLASVETAGDPVPVVETIALQGQQITVLAARSGQESFGFVWSHSQRHGGGVCSAAMLSSRNC